jgi:hypothetical protein
MRSAAALLSLALAFPAAASDAPGGFGLSVLVDGAPRPEYRTRGTVYIEALRGRTYALRVTNPLPVRVAVALSVDGLDTIDARRTPAREARKWVLAPYETILIEGWQVSGSAARKFVFTGERGSYAAKLGETENLGTIEAVFFREKATPVWRESRSTAAPAPTAKDGARKQAAGAPGPVAQEAQADLSDEYAATGMGNRTRHDVRAVFLDLEDAPSATVRIRYEFREALARLGVFPRSEDPLERRERGTGFGSYCPER